MGNTLTSVTADAFKAAEKIGREGVGALNSVLLNAGSEAVAKGQAVKSITTAEPTLNSSVTPAMTIPEGDDQTFGQVSFTVDSVANVMINITGEEAVHIGTNYDYETVQGLRLERAFRKIRNTIEAAACTAIYKGASRAYGTAGTTPFGSNFNEIAEIRQILFDNGFFVDGEMSLVVDSLAGTNLRQLASLQKVNESGGTDMLRMGELLNLQGFSLKESAGIASHTKGTGTTWQTSAAEAVGSTTINVDTSNGTLVTGDVVSFTGDSVNKYVAQSGLSANGTFTIGDPGIKVAVSDDTAMAIGNNYTANLAINRSAVEIVARPLAAPSQDAATDVLQVPDPITGLVYEIREYSGFHKKMWSISVVYGTKVWQSQGVAVLLG